jgi:hypothetical protein
MAQRLEQGSGLSVERAFVVHLRAHLGTRRRRFSGRVEHLSSGQSVQFSSLDGLLAFFGRVLAGSGAAAPRGRDEREWTNRP